MGAVRADRGVAVDPEAPRLVGAVTPDAGARSAPYLVAGWWGASQYGQGRRRAGDRIAPVQCAVHVQGGDQAGRPFGQFSVMPGRETTFVSQLRPDADLAGPQQDTARHALRAAHQVEAVLRFVKHRITQHQDTDVTFEAECLACDRQADSSTDGVAVDIECMSHTGRTGHPGFRRLCASFALVERAE